MFVVPKILGHRQRREAHSEPGARRFVHLSVNHHHVWQYARRFHVVVEFLAFTTSFAYPAKNAHPLLVLDHVVDHFGEQYRLANTRSAEQAGFAAALDRHQHIYYLDAGFKDLGLGGTPCQCRRCLMDCTPLDPCRRRLAVDGVPEHVEHARENFLANRRLKLPAGVFHRIAAGETLSGCECDSAHGLRIGLS